MNACTHTYCHYNPQKVSSQFSQVFQLTITYLIDELLSPLITPFVLYFSLRNKSQDIIDFLRNFTIEVSGNPAYV